MAAEVRVLVPYGLPLLCSDTGDDCAGFDGKRRQGSPERGVGASRLFLFYECGAAGEVLLDEGVGKLW